MLTFSAQNSTKVLSNSSKWFHTFLLNSFGEFSFSCWIAFCVINSYILTTKQLILYWYSKEKIDVNKLAGAGRVKEWLVTAYQLQYKLAALNFLLETSSLQWRICGFKFGEIFESFMQLKSSDPFENTCLNKRPVQFTARDANTRV